MTVAKVKRAAGTVRGGWLRSSSAPVPSVIDRVLALQRQAGNQAVARMLAPGTQAEDRAPVVQRDTPGVPPVLTLQPVDPIANAKRYVQLNHPNPDGSATVDDGDKSITLPADQAKAQLADARLKKEQYFSGFAKDRSPFVDQVRSATDDAVRHDKLVALRDHDAPSLTGLNAVKDALGGRWDIDSADSRDAVLAAIQMSAEGAAEVELDKGRDDVRTRVRTDTGGSSGDEWCGEFAMDHYATGDAKPVMDADFKKAFMSTTSLENFFRYVSDPDLIGRSPRWMADDGKWVEVQSYQATRGSPRQWQKGSEVGHGGFDIRAGDIAVLDTSGHGTSDHIVTVQSFDPSTGRMVTVGGNDSGWVPDTSPDHPEGALAGEGAAAEGRRHHAEAATGRKLKDGPGTGGQADGGHVGVNVVDGTPGSYQIYGVGRPSLVDFEEHVYDKHDATAIKPAAPAPKTH